MLKLNATDIRVAYGLVEVLKGVSVELQRGEVIVLLGPSGSGKTTLLRAIAGLETPSTGRIQIEDRVVFDAETAIDLPTEDRNLGFVFQSYALWPHRTAFDNVAYGLRLQKKQADAVRERVESALKELGLGCTRRALPASTLRWPAATCRYRASAGLSTARYPHGRAPFQPRCATARRGESLAACANSWASVISGSRHA